MQTVRAPNELPLGQHGAVYLGGMPVQNVQGVITLKSAAYELGYRLLKHRENAMLEEGEHLYRTYGAQRAMGFMDGYRLAITHLSGMRRSE